METQVELKAGQYLTFVLDKQVYGVSIESVREIDRLSEITSLPRTPHFIAGVMNLRGKVIPVVNLRLRLGFESIPYNRETCIIVIDGERGQVGMIVDSVKAVIGLTSSQIEPRPVIGEESKDSFVRGIGKVEDEVIVLLSITDCLMQENLAYSSL